MELIENCDDWFLRLDHLFDYLAVTQQVPVMTAAEFRGILVVINMGLGNPYIRTILREALEILSTIEHPQLTPYIQRTIAIFDREVILGGLIVNAVLNKNGSEGEIDG